MALLSGQWRCSDAEFLFVPHIGADCSFLKRCQTLRQKDQEPVADLRGGRKGRAPPGPKCLHFHAVFGKNWPNNRLAPPPLGNPGSTTENIMEPFVW